MDEDDSRHDDPVRFAVAGYGFGGRYFHAPLIAHAKGCELVGVITRSPERRTLLAVEHPEVRAFDDLDQAAAAGAEAVAISTPVHTHSELTDQALGLGLHVVTDKPFALDATAASRSVELAERVGRRLSPYQNRRWDADFLTVRRLVDSGRLSTVTRFESRFERFAPDVGPGMAGGGTLLDFGSHLVDQALVLLGPARQVYANWRVRETGRDDDVFVALTHSNGTRTHLWCSWSQAAPGPRYRVTGTDATYVNHTTMDCQEQQLLSGETPASLGDRWGVEPRERWGALHHSDEVEAIPSEPGAWTTYYPAFAAAVRDAGPVPVKAADAVATAEVLDAARLSATSGAVVTVD